MPVTRNGSFPYQQALAAAGAVALCSLAALVTVGASDRGGGGAPPAADEEGPRPARQIDTALFAEGGEEEAAARGEAQAEGMGPEPCACGACGGGAIALGLPLHSSGSFDYGYEGSAGGYYDDWYGNNYWYGYGDGYWAGVWDNYRRFSRYYRKYFYGSSGESRWSVVDSSGEYVTWGPGSLGLAGGPGRGWSWRSDPEAGGEISGAPVATPGTISIVMRSPVELAAGGTRFTLVTLERGSGAELLRVELDEETATVAVGEEDGTVVVEACGPYDESCTRQVYPLALPAAST